MGKRNFIKNWLPVLVLLSIAAVVAVMGLAVWLISNKAPSADQPATPPSGYTANTGQGTTSPEDDIPEPPLEEIPEPTTTDPDDPPPTTQPSTPVEPSQPIAPSNDRLSCDKIAIFSGKFAEDGSDKPVENVAALLVTNRTDQFLDMATIQYEVDGKKASFIVSGLPAGESCWVMEYTAMSITAESSLKYIGCTPSFRDDAVKTAQEISVSADGNILCATNNTDRTLKDVFVYYKSLHEDGNYFGGITYMVTFGDLKPGESIEKLGGHYTQDESVIVRVGWQESQTDGIT